MFRVLKKDGSFHDLLYIINFKNLGFRSFERVLIFNKDGTSKRSFLNHYKIKKEVEKDAAGVLDIKGESC
jgi:hypothetical protein